MVKYFNTKMCGLALLLSLSLFCVGCWGNPVTPSVEGPCECSCHKCDGSSCRVCRCKFHENKCGDTNCKYHQKTRTYEIQCGPEE